MANVSQSLKDYLSNSAVNQPLSTNNISQNSTSGSWYSKFLPRSNVISSSEDTANGWFSEAQKDPFLPQLSMKQRVLGFMGCLLMGTFCFSLASLYIPFLIVKARKFALLYTLGSLFIIFSFSLLWGPMNHLKSLLKSEQLPFTSAYFGTLFATLYFSLLVKSTLLTVIFAVAQILALIWYIISFIPGGQTGLSFFSKLLYTAFSKTAKTAAKTLPV